MTASSKMAKIIKVVIRKKDEDVYVARSPDLPGFLALSHDLPSLHEVICKHIGDLYLAAGQPVLVAPVDMSNAGEENAEIGRPWVAMPVNADTLRLEAAR